jgi:NADH-ubiquinone oxidoreductase chain 6
MGIELSYLEWFMGFAALSIYEVSNPIISLGYFISIILSLAILLISLDYNFLGLIYIVVYVGAIAILILFIIMLLNIKSDDYYILNDKDGIQVLERNASHINIGGLILLFGIFYLLIMQGDSNSFLDSLTGSPALPGGLGIMDAQNNWNEYILDIDELTSLGYVLYSEYGLLLIILGFVLLLSMIGAIVLISIKK